MKRIFELFFQLFRSRPKKKNGVLPPVSSSNNGQHAIDDAVLKTIADLGGPKRASHGRKGKAPRIFDRK
jgi:hypothetical protein|uniref:Uncharacterized protein n=1 Tax=Leptospirillum ferriphilum TaxID=178606 RepID=A0A7C3LS41_9BACT